MKQIGSGTLIVVADQEFVLTAAHVVRDAANGQTLGISGFGGGPFISTAGQWIVSAPSQASSSEDPLDIALYPLTKDKVASLSRSEFVRIADVSFKSDLSNAYFILSGFPRIWSTTLDGGAEKTMQSRLLQYSTHSFAGESRALSGYDENRHFLLDATRTPLVDQNGDETSFRTRSGFPANMPGDLGGISGCSVWLVGDPYIPFVEWNAGSGRLVGVETGVYERRGAIKATRWNAVIMLIYSAFPSLRPVLEFYRKSFHCG